MFIVSRNLQNVTTCNQCEIKNHCEDASEAVDNVNLRLYLSNQRHSDKVSLSRRLYRVGNTVITTLEAVKLYGDQLNYGCCRREAIYYMDLRFSRR
jgi:hypothetical protein